MDFYLVLAAVMAAGVFGVVYLSKILDKKEERENPSLLKHTVLMLFMGLNYMSAFMLILVFLFTKQFLFALLTAVICYSAYKYANLKGHGRATFESEW